jgi:hypothetical protein
MNKLVEKVIKLCAKICEDSYPITNLNIYSHYNVGFTINGISIYIRANNLEVHTRKGVLCTDINTVENASLVIATQKVKEHSEKLAENILDEYLIKGNKNL